MPSDPIELAPHEVGPWSSSYDAALIAHATEMVAFATGGDTYIEPKDEAENTEGIERCAKYAAMAANAKILALRDRTPKVDGFAAMVDEHRRVMQAPPPDVEMVVEVPDTSLLNRADDGSAGGRELVRELARREKLTPVLLTDAELQAALPTCIPLSELPDPAPALTVERVRAVMAEYVKAGTWKSVGDGRWERVRGHRYARIDRGIAEGCACWGAAWRPITTEPELRAFCEGRGA